MLLAVGVCALGLSAPAEAQLSCGGRIEFSYPVCNSTCSNDSDRWCLEDSDCEGTGTCGAATTCHNDRTRACVVDEDCIVGRGSTVPVRMTLRAGELQNNDFIEIPSASLKLDCETVSLFNDCVDAGVGLDDLVEFDPSQTIATNCPGIALWQGAIDGVDPNQANFVAIPSLQLDPLEQCDLNFEVKINRTLGDPFDPDPIRQSALFEGDCTPIGLGIGQGTGSIPLNPPLPCPDTVELDKQVSCDGGDTWYDVGDFGPGDSSVEGCTGWENPAEVKHRYRARVSPGGGTVENCMIMEQNGALPVCTPSSGPLGPGEHDLCETDVFECTDPRDGPSQATLICDCSDDLAVKRMDTDTSDLVCKDAVPPQLETECGPDEVFITVTNVAPAVDGATLVDCTVAEVPDQGRPRICMANPTLTQGDLRLSPGESALYECTRVPGVPESYFVSTCEIEDSTCSGGPGCRNGRKTVTSARVKVDDCPECPDDIQLDKQISCDGGTTWHDENDYGDTLLEQCTGWDTPAEVKIRYYGRVLGDMGAVENCMIIEDNPFLPVCQVNPAPLPVSPNRYFLCETDDFECVGTREGPSRATLICECEGDPDTVFMDTDTAALECKTVFPPILKTQCEADKVAINVLNITSSSDGATFVDCTIEEVPLAGEPNICAAAPMLAAGENPKIPPGGRAKYECMRVPGVQESYFIATCEIQGSTCVNGEPDCRNGRKTVDSPRQKVDRCPKQCPDKIKFDKEISCDDGFSWHDVDDYGHDDYDGCVGWTDQEEIRVRYMVEVIGDGAVECEITSSTGAPTCALMPVDGGLACEVPDAFECMDTDDDKCEATVECVCIADMDKKFRATDIARLECKTPRLDVDKQCELDEDDCSVRLKKEVSCDGYDWVDADRWHGCRAAEHVKVRYSIKNTGDAELYNCELNESNKELFDSGYISEYDPIVVGPKECTADLAAGEPDTATVICECGEPGGPQVGDYDEAYFECDCDLDDADVKIQVEVVPEERGKHDEEAAVFRFLGAKTSDGCHVDSVKLNGFKIRRCDLMRLELDDDFDVELDTGDYDLRMDAKEFIFSVTASDGGTSRTFEAALLIEDFAGAELARDEVVASTARLRGTPIDDDARDEFEDHVDDLLDDGFRSPNLPSALITSDRVPSCRETDRDPHGTSSLAPSVGDGVSAAAAGGVGDDTLEPFEPVLGNRVVSGGVGLEHQPGEISIAVPGGTTVEQVLLYWNEFHRDGFADDTATVNGMEVQGELIGGPRLFFGSTYSSTYRADIAHLNLFAPGMTGVAEIAGLGGGADPDDFRANGASIVVVLADAARDATVEIREGQDLAFKNFDPPLDRTEAQTFFFPASTKDRVARLTLAVGSVLSEDDRDRPNNVKITVQPSGLPQDQCNILRNNVGEQWDHQLIKVFIPGGSTSVTVEVESGKHGSSGTPASLVWTLAAFELIDADRPPGCENKVKIKFNVPETPHGEAESATLKDCTVVDDLCDDPPSPDFFPGPFGPGEPDPRAMATCRVSGLTETTENEASVECVIEDAFDRNGDPKTITRTATDDCVCVEECAVQIMKEVDCGDGFGSSCTGWDGEQLAVKYSVANVGVVDLTNCVVMDTNTAVSPGPIMIGDIPVKGMEMAVDDDNVCSDDLDHLEPDTATVICECDDDSGRDARDHDTAYFECQEAKLNVEKTCEAARDCDLHNLRVDIQVEVDPEERGEHGVDEAVFRLLGIEQSDSCELGAIKLNGFTVKPCDLLRLELDDDVEVEVNHGEYALRMESPEYVFSVTARDSDGNTRTFKQAVLIEDFAGAELDEDEVEADTVRQRGRPIDDDAEDEFDGYVTELFDEGWVNPPYPSAIIMKNVPKVCMHRGLDGRGVLANDPLDGGLGGSSPMLLPGAPLQTGATAGVPMEQLTPFPLETGTGLISAGTGLVNQPGAITIDVPENAIVRQVLLYWNGFHAMGMADDEATVDGMTVEGTLIGGPTLFFGSTFSSTYRADITHLMLIPDGPGSATVMIKDLNFSGTESSAANGASIVVVIDDGSAPAVLALRDGQDLTFDGFDGDLGMTVAQVFEFAPADTLREAKLTLFAGSVEGAISSGNRRPNRIKITLDPGGIRDDRLDLFFSNVGDEWDHHTIMVDLPPGTTRMTVEAQSFDDGSDDKPASFAWIGAGLQLGSCANHVKVKVCNPESSRGATYENCIIDDNLVEGSMDGFIEGPLKPGECESVRFEIPPLDKPTVNEVTVTCDIVGSDEKKKMVSAEALCDCTSGEAAMVTLPINLH